MRQGTRKPGPYKSHVGQRQVKYEPTQRDGLLGQIIDSGNQTKVGKKKLNYKERKGGNTRSLVGGLARAWAWHGHQIPDLPSAGAPRSQGDC